MQVKKKQARLKYDLWKADRNEYLGRREEEVKDAGHMHDSETSRLLRFEEIEEVQLRWMIFSMFRAQLFESGRIDEIDISKKIQEEHRGSTWSN